MIHTVSRRHSTTGSSRVGISRADTGSNTRNITSSTRRHTNSSSSRVGGWTMSTLPSCLKRLLENTLIRGGVPDSHVLVPVGRALCVCVCMCVCVCVCVCVCIYMYIYIYIQMRVSVSVGARILRGGK